MLIILSSYKDVTLPNSEGSKDTANVAVALHNTFLEELESRRDLI